MHFPQVACSVGSFRIREDWMSEVEWMVILDQGESHFRPRADLF